MNPKTIGWIALTTLASAAGAALAARGATFLWCKIVGEDPPTPPTWMKWLVGKPMQAGVSGALDGAKA